MSYIKLYQGLCPIEVREENSRPLIVVSLISFFSICLTQIILFFKFVLNDLCNGDNTRMQLKYKQILKGQTI